MNSWDVTTFLDSLEVQPSCTLQENHSVASNFFYPKDGITLKLQLNMKTSFSVMQKMLVLFDGILQLFEGSLSAAAKTRLLFGFKQNADNYSNKTFAQYRKQLVSGEVLDPATLVDDLDLRFDRVARLDAWLSAANLASFKVSSQVCSFICSTCLLQALPGRSWTMCTCARALLNLFSPCYCNRLLTGSRLPTGMTNTNNFRARPTGTTRSLEHSSSMMLITIATVQVSLASRL